MKKKAFFCFALPFFISGCDQNAELLRAEKKAADAEARYTALVEKVNGDYAERIAKLNEKTDYWDSQATRAAACDYLIPICPSSLTAAGREAIAAGYGGAGVGFYALVAAKLAALVAVVAAALGALAAVFYRFVMPARSEVEAARAAVAGAGDQVRALDEDRQQIEAEIERLQRARQQAEAARARATDEAAAAAAQLHAIREQIEAEQNKKTERDAVADAISAAFGKKKG